MVKFIKIWFYGFINKEIKLRVIRYLFVIKGEAVEIKGELYEKLVEIVNELDFFKVLWIKYVVI